MDDRPIALTIGTAGHVDHGKTTLVRYMTGTDTDRLEEEHRRGISIVPGYAELDLPGGRRASLVDVPGHERFVKNMVAGATGVDAFLLVVAADDGVMPQTREHLDVLRVLGVRSGVVALTKIDAVDEEMVELAELDAAELLESVGFEAPIIPVSGATGEGMDMLLSALDELARGSDARSGPLARLPVDRAFVLKGIGLIATGTLWSGEIRVGDTLYTAAGLRPRVRSVQNHGRPAEVAHAGARTALDLVGVEAGELKPGDVLLSSPVPESRTLDARIQLLENAFPLRHGTRLRLYHGTQATNARVRLLDHKEVSPGESALARLVLQEGLVVLPGDRFVLRSSSPHVTVGGGAVLDAAPPAGGRRPEPDWLEALESGDPARVVPLSLARAPKRGMTVKELALVVPATPAEILATADTDSEVVKLGDLYALAGEVEAARERLFEALNNRAEDRPESPELSIAEARTATGLDSRLADALLAEMSETPAEEAGARVRVGEAGVSLPDPREVPPELEKEAEEMLEFLQRTGTEPPALDATPAVRLLLKRGQIVRLTDGLFAASDVAETILEDIKSACREEGEISLSNFRDQLGTSRKYAQAWLEYADSVGVTRRVGDARVLTRRYR